MAMTHTLVLSAILLALASPAEGQLREPALFDRCALRLEHRYGGIRIVRGVQEEPVATVGWIRGPKPALFARSDSAVFHARAGNRQRGESTGVMLRTRSMDSMAKAVWWHDRELLLPDSGAAQVDADSAAPGSLPAECGAT